jgi:hypothetical protein
MTALTFLALLIGAPVVAVLAIVGFAVGKLAILEWRFRRALKRAENMLDALERSLDGETPAVLRKSGRARAHVEAAERLRRTYEDACRRWGVDP